MPAPITSISQLDKHGVYTYADYLTWRFSEMVELIKGRLFITSPAPASKHQDLSAALLRNTIYYFWSKDCKVYHAPFDVRPSGKSADDAEVLTVVQPDICVICDSTKVDERGCAGAPDWIIEIVSPSTAKKDLNDKYNLYEENGVQEYWVVFPDANAINQYVLVDDKYEYTDTFGRHQKLSPELFPDLVFDLKEVFP
jgi:Uma2 family endonuclease